LVSKTSKALSLTLSYKRLENDSFLAGTIYEWKYKILIAKMKLIEA